MKPENFHTVVVGKNEHIGNFPDFTAALYQSDKKRIRPLDKETENIFHPDFINFLETGMLYAGFC